MSCCSKTAQPILRRFAARGTMAAPAIRALSTTTAPAPTVTANTGPGARSDRGPRRFDNRRGGSNNGFPKRGAPAQPPMGLPELLKMLTKLKADGRKPTAAAYLAIIRSAADYSARRGDNREKGDESGNTLGLEIALGAMRDAKAGGIELGPEALDQMFRFTLLQPEILPSLLIEVTNRGTPTAAAYIAMAQQTIGTGRFEELLVIFAEMLHHNYTPERSMVHALVRMACEWGLPRMAVQIVDRAEALPGARKVEPAAWVPILIASADASLPEGIDKAWSRCVANNAYTPDEGLILQVLAAAGRWGRVRLATTALEMLPKIGVAAQEHHMQHLIAAYCREGLVPDALKLIGQIRSSGIVPTLSTVRPIISVLRNAELLDQAFYALEDMHKAGVAVDVMALNAVIAAAEQVRDLERARATQLAAADLGVTPDLDTFNIVLSACSNARHMELSTIVFSELTDAGLTPNAVSFENMIRTCTKQDDYENCFWYLEKMKGEGFKPSRQIYLDIGKKCFRRNDPRYKLVGEEMATIGYEVPNFEAEVQKSDTALEERKQRRLARGTKGSSTTRGTNNRNNRRRRDDQGSSE